ncbi:MAG TPA: c-type cytochrome [Paraburkholderia sp.]|nr:c-type cytochrome [Paraburkholderia sp.]
MKPVARAASGRARRVCAALLLAAAAVPLAHAADAPRGLVIAQGNACLGCHAVDRKLVGPSFQQVAERYKGNGQAQALLERKVKEGGAGVWGVIPMPAHSTMSNADIRTVVSWVLAGAPSK